MKKLLLFIFFAGALLASNGQSLKRYPGGGGPLDTLSAVPSLYKHRQDSITLRNLINTNTTSTGNKADKTTALTVNGTTQDISIARTWTITGFSLLSDSTGQGGKYPYYDVATHALKWGGMQSSKIAQQYFTGFGTTGYLTEDSLYRVIQTKTAAYTVATTDNFIRADATSAAFTVTLQLASAYTANKIIRVKKIDTGTNAVTIAAGGSDTIDGASTYSLSTAYQGVLLMQTASNKWDVVGKF